MRMKNARRALGALLALAPSIGFATDTLDCSGEAYSVQFHVGSEGIVDFTLFGSKGPLANGDRTDLDVVRFQWLETEDYSKNALTVQTRSGFPAPFKLVANGERGLIEVENVVAPVVCDWAK